MKGKTRGGFTLIELIVYTAIFAASATFLVSILGVVTRIQIKQVAANEVNQQISFVNNTIRQMVQGSSLIEIDTGSVPPTLTLRMSSSSLDKTFIYASGTTIYLEQGVQQVLTGNATALTDSNVRVDTFSFEKYNNPGGPAVLNILLIMSYNSQNPQSQVTRRLETAISRISASIFDSSLVPDQNNIRDFGNSSLKWKDGYLSGDLLTDGRIRVGTTWSSLLPDMKIVSGGNINFTSSSYGIVLMSPSGSFCYRLRVTESGGLATSTATCPAL